MKWMVVLLAVLAGVGLWQRGRRMGQPPPPRGKRPAATPMARCARCGTHVPGNEAVLGRNGGYCCVQHRREAEGA